MLPNPLGSLTEVCTAQRINAVKFRQDAAVSAYITVHWIDDTEKSKDLGPWKSINQEETFNLVDEGVPDGSMVRARSLLFTLRGDWRH